MRPLYTQEQFEKTKSKNTLPCQCYVCENIFYKKKSYILHELKTNKGQIKFCSENCRAMSRTTKQIVFCKNCNKEFYKLQSELKKGPNNFCSHSCHATYINTHKTHGTRRSKLEVYIEEQLMIIYPNIHIDFNKKDAINSELDIYIPSLKLAFELNGIFHYEPIFGQEKFTQIQNNDERKFQACIENVISLCIIDTSGLKYFKPEKANTFLNIIAEIINNKISV